MSGLLPGFKNNYIIAGLSGYGIMSSNALGELLALQITNFSGNTADGKHHLPEYASTFSPHRYENKAYLDAALSGSIVGEQKASL